MTEPLRRVKIFIQPLGYAKDLSNVKAGEVWIYDGWPHRMAGRHGWVSCASDEITPRRRSGPRWARGYDRDKNGVWHWINRRTQLGAVPYPKEEE